MLKAPMTHCPHQVSPLKKTEQWFNKTPFKKQDTVMYVDPITHQTIETAIPTSFKRNPENVTAPYRETDDWYVVTQNTIKKTHK